MTKLNIKLVSNSAFLDAKQYSGDPTIPTINGFQHLDSFPSNTNKLHSFFKTFYLLDKERRKDDSYLSMNQPPEFPNLFRQEIYSGGVVHLNTNNTNIWFEGLTHFYFRSFYPSAIIGFKHKSECDFTRNLGYLLADLLIQMRTYELTNSIKAARAYHHTKAFVNFCYGVLTNVDSSFTQKTTNFTTNLMKTIVERFSSNIVYLDVDEIYFREYQNIKEQLELHIKEYDHHKCLSWGTEPGFRGIFLAKKKNITINLIGNVTVKGVKTRISRT